MQGSGRPISPGRHRKSVQPADHRAKLHYRVSRTFGLGHLFEELDNTPTSSWDILATGSEQLMTVIRDAHTDRRAAGRYEMSLASGQPPATNATTSVRSG